MFLDCVAVVGERLVTVTSRSSRIEVCSVLTGQVVHIIHTGYYYYPQSYYGTSNRITCIAPVPGHSEWIVGGGDDGAVHLWDIEKGAQACECMNECRCARATNCAT
jgi:WD40 repeat protein